MKLPNNGGSYILDKNGNLQIAQQATKPIKPAKIEKEQADQIEIQFEFSPPPSDIGD